jgi:hypothetical protein
MTPTDRQTAWPPHFSEEERRYFHRTQRRRALRRPPLDVLKRSHQLRHRLRGVPIERIAPLDLMDMLLPISGGASFFEVTLDTTGPATPTFKVAAGATYITSVTTTADFTTADSSTTGYQVKIWGTDIDKTFNSAIQETEEASEWISFAASVAIKVKSGDGTKTVHAKIRDDVWNETAELSDSVTLDTTVPVATVSSGPDVEKVSKISGKRTVSFEFQADVAIQAWKVKVVPATNSIHSAGTTIGTTNGSTNVTGAALAATTNKAVTIDGRDLETASSGDGKKIIKVFVQDEAGNWSTA